MNHNIDVCKVDSIFDHCVIMLTSCDDKQLKDKNWNKVYLQWPTFLCELLTFTFSTQITQDKLGC